MSDEPDDVDPENARPEGHYPRFRDNTWHYVPDHLAQTISLGPGGDGEPGQDWVLSYTPERRNEEDREKVFIRLPPRSLHELYIEATLSRWRRLFRTRAESPFIGTATWMPTAGQSG